MNRKNYHVWLAITFLPLFIFVGPLIPVVGNNVMPLVTAIAAAFVLLALFAGAWFDAILSGFVALAFLASAWLFPSIPQPILTIRTCSSLAFFFLNLVLLIGPWSRFSSLVRGWYRYRRHLGVTAFFLADLHFSLIFGNYFYYSPVSLYIGFFTFFGSVALLILWALALTSWDYLQKHVGNNRWKKIHLGVFLAYLALIGFAVWANLSQGGIIEAYQYVVIAAFIGLWILAAPWGFAPRFVRFLSGWKQLHVLIHIAFASVVLHGYLAYVRLAPAWVQVLFLGLPLFVWGSHAAGWIIKRREDLRFKAQAAASRQIQIDGKTYWSVGRPEDFEEGKAKKFLVRNMPIAVFKYQNKFFGLFAQCAHQKGPIDQGKIVNGYVECPWHGWQYSCEGGQAPPGYTDNLGYYPCVEQDGWVWVSQSPKAAKK